MASKKINRRKFVQHTATGVLGAATLAGCSTFSTLVDSRQPAQVDESDLYDFIIVGSGAGGGPLAAGLARAGFSVFLLEAGSKDQTMLSRIPVAHAKASEDEEISWKFFVDRYRKDSPYYSAELKNTKYQKEPVKRGEGPVFYPRAAGVGGCTRMNALIHLYPDYQDWERLSKNMNGSDIFHPAVMYKTYQNMLVGGGANGWLNLKQASPLNLIKDTFLRKMALSAANLDGLAYNLTEKTLNEALNFKLDPNKVYAGIVKNKKDGIFNMPFNATDGIRNGVYEYLLNTESKFPQNLKIQSKSLCTKIRLSEPGKNGKRRALGIEYIEKPHVYRADPNASQESTSYVSKVARARYEVILSGGAFNTPQLLMLSGIGDAATNTKVATLVDLPGVGKNLQDRYEVTVVTELNKPIDLVGDCRFAHDYELQKSENKNFATLNEYIKSRPSDRNGENDKCLEDYMKSTADSSQVYGTNGVAISLIRSSSSKQSTPDLCIFGLPGRFTGYYPGYSNDTTRSLNPGAKEEDKKNYFTWAILKGHTKNKAGEVTLRTADPRDTPNINFRYFDQLQAGQKSGGDLEDLNAVATGVKQARRINDLIGDKFIKTETYPGRDNVNTDAELQSWIMQEAWGHHASCTNQMGILEKNPKAVVDEKFKVHKVDGLRIVDASVFPDIPGLFIMLPTLMMSERAKDLIIEEYKDQRRS